MSGQKSPRATLATTLRGGSVIKFDPSGNSSLVVKGALVCETEPYNPAILTSVDDDSQGEWVSSVSTGDPQTASNGAAYLNLDAAAGNILSNLRICYADQGVTTPVTAGALDVWDCQFFDCNYAIANLVPAFGSVDFLHNVLFAHCAAAVAASTNSIEIEAEHVTADVEDFWVAGATPYKIGLTNSIIRGNFGNGAITINEKSAINPSGRVFQRAEQGGYYLAADSALRGSGTTNVSPKLLAEFGRKTTRRPFSFPALFQTGGEMTLFPQAPRYTSGPPDIGYWYDALDYTVAVLQLTGGSLTVLPGTAIGIRNDYIRSDDSWSTYGFYVNQGGSITSHGAPDKPDIFAAAVLVQEEPNVNFAECLVEYYLYLYEIYGVSEWHPGILSFVTDFEPGDPTSPSLDFRFSDFYLPADDLHFGSGLSYDDFWIWSSDSSVNLNLQDCSLHNGQVNLGQPDAEWFRPDQVFGSGAVTWNNTLFENVSVNLDPTSYEDGCDDQGLNVDLSFQAGNNLFRGGQWLHLEPIPASAGDWAFEDNLFDKVNIVQDTSSGQYQPLDYDYNGYWPLSTNALTWNSYFYPWHWLQNTGELQPTAPTNGFTDGQHEVTLASHPPYQNGPFGHYYMPANTLLYEAGSRTADAAGFCQYTTRVDQTKEQIGEPVDIGLHYVAASHSTNGWVPLDTDGDGIPDYVEDANGNGVVDANETSPYTQFTVPGVWDPTNAVYDNIDLGGAGLAGNITTALALDPRINSTPLTLTQIITGQEPDIATFQVPINYNLMTNIGQLQLLVDGSVASFLDCEPDSNGLCVLTWNTTFSPPGFHLAQAQLMLNGQYTMGPTPDPTVLTAAGPLTSFKADNGLQFDPFYCAYNASHGATLYAQLAEPDADYTIELVSPTGEHVRWIENTTSSGVINEPWDMTYDDGITVYTNSSVNAVFNVTLLDPGGYTHTLRLDQLYDLADGAFTVAYAWDYDSDAVRTGDLWGTIQWNVVDLLMEACNVSFCFDNPYPYTFNAPDNVALAPNPGYIANQDGVNQLLANLTNDSPNIDLTRNFFFFGHGAPDELGDGNRQQVEIKMGKIAGGLGNIYYLNSNSVPLRQYRFVFLDTCDTADDFQWAHAFGIYTNITSAELGPWPERAQAFVGWVGQQITPNDPFDMSEAFEVFFSAWQSGLPLDNCIYFASMQYPPYPLNGFVEDWNFGAKCQHYNIARRWIYKPTVNPAHLRIYGYAGLTRTGYIPGFDQSIYYK
jgi:hypothetical protein